MNNEEIENLPTQQPPQEAQEVDEFDTSGDIAQLQGIEKELQDIEASLENNFAEYITQLIDNDPTFEELFFNDRKTFFKKVIEAQNEFVISLTEPLQNKASEIETQIQGKQELGKIDLIKRKFQAEHPDVDIKELIMFFANELPPKVQQEIKAQPIERFFDLVYAIYQQMTNPQGQEVAPPPQDESLPPPQAQGVATSSENASANASQLPLDRM